MICASFNQQICICLDCLLATLTLALAQCRFQIAKNNSCDNKLGLRRKRGERKLKSTNKRFILAPSFWGENAKAIYTKLIKIQLGKKFLGLSNKYCKICKKISHFPHNSLYIEATPLFSFPWHYLSFPCDFHLSFDCQSFCLCFRKLKVGNRDFCGIDRLPLRTWLIW